MEGKKVFFVAQVIWSHLMWPAAGFLPEKNPFTCTMRSLHHILVLPADLDILPCEMASLLPLSSTEICSFHHFWEFSKKHGLFCDAFSRHQKLILGPPKNLPTYTHLIKSDILAVRICQDHWRFMIYLSRWWFSKYFCFKISLGNLEKIWFPNIGVHLFHWTKPIQLHHLLCFGDFFWAVKKGPLVV